MNGKRLISYFLLFMLVSCSSGKLMEGRKNFEREEYFQAVENFREVYPKLKSKDEKAELVYKLGKSYHLQGDYSKALPWLKNAVRYAYPDQKLKLMLAETNKSAEKLEESIRLFETYLESFPNDQRAQNGLRGIQLAQNWKETPSLYQIENASRLNSIGNEWSVSYWGGASKILIASSRDEASGKAVNPIDGQKYADLFSSKFDSSAQKWTLAERLEESDLNGFAHESHIHCSNDGQKMVLSRATYSATNPLIHQLYFSIKIEGKWSTLQLIYFSTDGFDYPQASWSADGDWLYFSSNRNGGQGGYDIWKAKLNDQQELEEPLNIGTPVNTLGDEIYPMEKRGDILYFSSDFHPGIGGKDIFKASKQSGQWEINNMAVPINSSADDFGIVFSGEGERGFLVSNRKGSRGFDLYHFFLPPHLFMCFGKVYNEETDSIISNVNIRVMGTDGMVSRMVTRDGQFQVELMPDNEYTLIAYKKGFLNAQAKISTKGLNEAREFQLEFKQTPTDKPIRLERIYYETGKWGLLPTSQKSLDELFEILQLNPTVRIEVSAHTDEVGDEAFNQKLSQKRAAEVVRYLIEKGISDSRLVAKGYGETRPFIVNAKLARNMIFLKTGDKLTPKFIATLDNDQQEITKSLNRRTEFEVIEE